MYESWVCRRWETPISDAHSVIMESLSDSACGLKIILDMGTDERSQRYKLSFEATPAYRNILEEYRLKLWERLDKTGRPGSTFIVENSPWITEMAASEPLLLAINKKLVHYVIATGDDVVEILSPKPPAITALGMP